MLALLLVLFAADPCSTASEQLGRGHLAVVQKADATIFFGAAVAAAPDCTQARVAFAAELVRRGRFGEASIELERARALGASEADLARIAGAIPKPGTNKAPASRAPQATASQDAPSLAELARRAGRGQTTERTFQILGDPATAEELAKAAAEDRLEQRRLEAAEAERVAETARTSEAARQRVKETRDEAIRWEAAAAQAPERDVGSLREAAALQEAAEARRPVEPSPIREDTPGPATLRETQNVCHATLRCVSCKGYSGVGGPCYAGVGGPMYAGVGGPCYAGDGGPMYAGVGGPAYAGVGGPCYAGVGGPAYAGVGGRRYDGVGGPRYDGVGGPRYNGVGGPAYAGVGGPCYAGVGGPCYTGVGGKGECPEVCH